MNLSKFFLLELFNKSFGMSGFRSILIANRGEIAVRIIRTAHQLGIDCAVIYTPQESNALFVREADKAFNLGEGSLHETYLNISKIIDIAVNNNIEAIHPGYGFLSENPEFVEACEVAGIIFIGPDSRQVRLMSNKLEARKYVESLGIPLLKAIHFDPELPIDNQTLDLTFPLIIKAAAGGGGKAMHVVHRPSELESSLETAHREALAYFGDSRVYLEQYLDKPRHIEVQLLGDKSGNIIHLYDRECTIQRRHQKIIEEAPSSFLSETSRRKMLEAALHIGRSMGYTSAGTIEFLLDGVDNFYFLEMNTRIQVEHPVTEVVTGIDIVREQLKIASGLPLDMRQEDVSVKGHGLECRIYAEDAFNHFLPSAGHMTRYQQPSSALARVDTCYDGPAEVFADFDPMIAKVIVLGKNRIDARVKMKGALDNFVIHGINTNVNYLNEVLDHSGYIKNILSTSFCKIASPGLLESFEKKLHAFSLEAIVAIFLIATFTIPLVGAIDIGAPVWQSLGYWRNLMHVEIEIFGKKHQIRFTKPGGNAFKVWLNNKESFNFSGHFDGSVVHTTSGNTSVSAVVTASGKNCFITSDGVTFAVHRTDTIMLKPPKLTGHGTLEEITAPLNGKILKINIALKGIVKKGDIMMIVESMKMENHIVASVSGVVEKIFVNDGDKVTGRDLLAILTVT